MSLSIWNDGGYAMLHSMIRYGEKTADEVENPMRVVSLTNVPKHNKTVVYDVTMIFEREIAFETLVLQRLGGLGVKRVREMSKLATVLRNKRVIAVSMREFMRYGYKNGSPYSVKRMFDNMNDMMFRGYVDRLVGAQWCLTGKGKALVAEYYSWLAGEHDLEAGLL